MADKGNLAPAPPRPVDQRPRALDNTRRIMDRRLMHAVEHTGLKVDHDEWGVGWRH